MQTDTKIGTIVLCWVVMVLIAMVPVGAYAQETNGTPQVPAAVSNNALDSSYRLGTGDKIHLNIFDQPDLTGDYVVDATGYVQLPLVGQVKASGETIADFQKDVTAKLADGYLKDPNVSIQIVNYRPFYIMGEVNKPGEYPYVSGMSILNAVVLAGGYTYRADDSEVYIRRNGSTKEVSVPADETTKVQPGDIIRVSERFF